MTLIQRVTQASVSVDQQVVGSIGPGLLALVAVEPDDGEAQFNRMAERLLGYRVFADEAGKMNRSLADTGGRIPGMVSGSGARALIAGQTGRVVTQRPNPRNTR